MLKNIALLAFAALAMLSCGSPTDHFQDNLGNRVYALSYADGTSDEELQNTALATPYNYNAITMIYFYPSSIKNPSEQIARATTLGSTGSAATPGFTHMFVRYKDGTTFFEDCSVNEVFLRCPDRS